MKYEIYQEGETNVEKYDSLVGGPSKTSNKGAVRSALTMLLLTLSVGSGLGVGYMELLSEYNHKKSEVAAQIADESLAYRKFDFISQLASSTQEGIVNGTYSLEHLKPSERYGFWTLDSFDYPDSLDARLDDLDSMSEQVMRASYPVMGLILDSMKEYDFPEVRNGVLIPSIFIRTETTNGNPFTVGETLDLGIAQFNPDYSDHFDLNIDPDFLRYMGESTRSGARGAVPILHALHRKALDNNTTMLQELDNLYDYCPAFDVRQAIPAMIKKIGGDLEISNFDINEVIVRYNTSWAWISSYRSIGAENLKSYNNYRFPTITREYMRSYAQYSNSLTNDRNRPIVNELLRTPSEDFDQILDQYESFYMEQLRDLTAIYEFNYMLDGSLTHYFEGVNVKINELHPLILEYDTLDQSTREQITGEMNSIERTLNYIIQNYLVD